MRNKETKKSSVWLSYRLIYIIFDLLFSFEVVTISFLSFYGATDFVKNIAACMIYASIVAVVTVLTFLIFKVYKIITSDIGLVDSIKIMAIAIGIHVIGLVSMIFIPQLPSARSFVFTWVLSTATVTFVHLLLRVLVRVFDIATSIVKKETGVRTIVIGAGSTGRFVIEETRRNKYNENYVVAAVDDDPENIGGLFVGVPVRGPISNVKAIIEEFKASEVIIALNDISKEKLHELYVLLEACPVRVRRMPLVSEMERPNDKRFIDVDLLDLLSRDPVSLDNHDLGEALKDKCVLVTGAGGSIGSELVRQVFNAKPKTLVLFDIYENSTYDIQMELMGRMRKDNIRDINLVTLIGSTYNENSLEKIFKKYKPDYIYHAAAYKHVPLMEDSPAEAIRTNVIGTYNVAKLADKYDVKKMVLVSTDKAVRPTNVMGATKRFAETIIQYFSDKSKSTKYAAVRFGNVLGSNGSVVPLFKKQIENGGPVTITDKNIIRYFMTIPEAVALILQCGLFAEGGEIFILDMGKPVKIYDLAEKLIRQAGLVPGVDIQIVETGLRPGEKLYEELLLDVEHQKKTANSRIYIEEKESINKNLEKDVIEASKAFDLDETKDVKKLLAKLINTYKEN